MHDTWRRRTPRAEWAAKKSGKKHNGPIMCESSLKSFTIAAAHAYLLWDWCSWRWPDLGVWVGDAPSLTRGKFFGGKKFQGIFKLEIDHN